MGYVASDVSLPDDSASYRKHLLHAIVGCHEHCEIGRDVEVNEVSDTCKLYMTRNFIQWSFNFFLHFTEAFVS